LSPFMKPFGEQLNSLDPNVIFPTINQFRIPIDYLASLFTAGDTEIIKNVLKKLVAMRTYMRYKELGKSFDHSILEQVGMTEEMYELSAIARYEDRYVIPKSHREDAGDMFSHQGTAGYDFMNDCTSCFVGGQADPLEYYESGFWRETDEYTSKGI